MRILFLTFQGKVAGSTMSISYLVRGLVERGHTVYVGCRPDNLLHELLTSTGAKVLPMRFRGRFDMKTIRAIRDTVRSERIDLINAQSTYDRYCSILARWLFRLPVRLVHTRRQMPKSAGGPLQSWVYHRGTDRIVAVSDGVKKGLVQRGIPARHVTVIRNGTPVEKYRGLDLHEGERLRQRFGIGERTVVIGCVSRRKNQDQLLRALEYVDVRTKVLFLGIGQDLLLRRILSTIDNRHDVQFLGLVPPEKALNYYPLFSVFVLPSTMEGLSQALLEAMCLEVPVIATRAGGNPELIKHGYNGYLFDDGDVRRLGQLITQVVLHPAQAWRMTRHARKTVREQFSMDRVVDEYEELFSSQVGVKDADLSPQTPRVRPATTRLAPPIPVRITETLAANDSARPAPRAQ